MSAGAITDENEIKRFKKDIDLSYIEIKGSFNFLNKLIKFSPEAFFYFKEAVTIYEECEKD